MAKQSNPWQTISLSPLAGLLDTRSRPADIPAGAFRWKQNLAISHEGKLSRRTGHAKAFAESLSYTNQDYHDQGQAVREPVNFQFESTCSDGTRRYFIGTQSNIRMLNEPTGLYTDIFIGKGAAGSRWKAAELKDVIVFTNNVDDVCAYAYTDPNPGTMFHNDITELKINEKVTKAKIVVQFQGFLILMNVEVSGVRMPNRILWSDLNKPFGWNTADPDNSLVGNQDLDPGEEILAAAEMGGRLYIYTRRGIWWMAPSGDTDYIFYFAHPYSEPKNQTGCLSYPNTLVSSGTEHWYLGRDGIYRFTPYVPAPVRDEWINRAAGVIFTKADTKLDPDYCEAPVGDYLPETKELWFSWPATGNDGINNWSLVAQLEQNTADVVDTGYTSFVNFRHTPTNTQSCNEAQDFLGASGVDWCLKSIGKVFYREYAVTTTPGVLETNYPDIASYEQLGYNSILRGLMPLGLPQAEKIVRGVLLDHDTRAQDVPCAVRMRVGNHRNMVDPNSTDETCSPQWNDLGLKTLSCPDPATIAKLTADGLRPDHATEWPCYDQGRFLWFELTVLNADGTAGVGGDSAFQRLDFDVMALPKPSP